MTIGWRNGVKLEVKPDVNLMVESKLVVRMEMRLNPNLNERALVALTQAEATPEIEIMRAMLDAHYSARRFDHGLIQIDYTISIDDFMDHGGSLYHHDLDMVFSINGDAGCPHHPYSRQGQTERIIDESIAGQLAATGEVSLAYGIEIIDNMRKYGPRFINIGGSVYRVVPKKDYRRQDGVYITTNGVPDNTVASSEINVRQYTLEDAGGKLGLFLTYEEAANSGDTVGARKQEILAMDHELAKMRADSQRERFEMDREMADITHRAKVADAERDQAVREKEAIQKQLDFERKRFEHDVAMATIRAKEEYETRSQARKDTGEVIKILPTLILGVGTAIIAIRQVYLMVNSDKTS